MSKKPISATRIAATYIGTVVGAGFATGQEVLQFFSAYGSWGLYGIILSTLLFIFYGYIIIEMGFTLKAQSHTEIIRRSGGKIIGGITDYLITFFLFGSLSAMIAGTGALFTRQFGVPGITGSILMTVITGLTVLTGINGVIKSISIVVPFLLTSVIGICLYTVIKTPPNISQTADIGHGIINNSFISSIIYVSYNTVISIAVLGPLGTEAKDRKSILWGSVLGGLGLGISSIMIYSALSGNMPSITGSEIPMSNIAGSISRVVQIAFSVVLVAEIYTTAVGSLYGFTARLYNDEKFTPHINKKTAIPAISLLALLASMLGFSNLVKYLYPAVGYGGILMLICTAFYKITHN